MIASIVFLELGKIQMWQLQLQEDIDGFESINDGRMCIRALRKQECHARFLPSLLSLPVS